MLQVLTCGESHGKYMMAVLEGMPSGIPIDHNLLQLELFRRQQGFGRGGRQKIERDRVELTAGVYEELTTGAPIGFLLQNKDEKIRELPQLYRPRPGHADLAGALKYQTGIRQVLERASARETVMRVAVGAVCKMFLGGLKIGLTGHVVQIGTARAEEDLSFDQIVKNRSKSSVNCASAGAGGRMVEEIKKAMANRDTVGGIYEIRVRGIPIGFGSHVHYKRKLDGRIAQTLMSMQSVKAVEVGLGVREGALPGSQAHDEIYYHRKKGYYHKTNRAGGLTGGMTNGMEIRVRATMKPISTLRRELWSVNMKTKKADKADFERSDICAVPAGSVIGEALVAFEIADAVLEKTGGDSLTEVKRNFEGYLKRLQKS